VQLRLPAYLLSVEPSGCSGANGGGIRPSASAMQREESRVRELRKIWVRNTHDFKTMKMPPKQSRPRLPITPTVLPRA